MALPMIKVGELKTRAEAARRQKVRVVELPELGGSICVRPQDIDTMLANPANRGCDDDPAEMKKHQILLLRECVCDEDGAPVLGPKEASEFYDAMDIDVMTKIVKQINIASGTLKEKGAESAEQAFVDAPS